MANLLIPQESAQKILDYLAKRPYAEVFEVIPHILNLAKQEEQAIVQAAKADLAAVETKVEELVAKV